MVTFTSRFELVLGTKPETVAGLTLQPLVAREDARSLLALPLI